MATYEEVNQYLEHTQQIIKTFDIYWTPRDEVVKGIRDLNLTEGIAKDVILGLVVHDYVEGPIEDHLYKQLALLNKYRFCILTKKNELSKMQLWKTRQRRNS